MIKWSALLVAIVMCAGSGAVATQTFDHGFAAYGELLRAVVHGPRVDYAALKAERSRLDRVVSSFALPTRAAEEAWPRAERMAFWINAYNALTLQAIVKHYPIRASFFSRPPKNSIRQIDGAWTTLSWPVAGRTVTLDDIEHRLLRPTFGDARIHFAVNCASISCPVLASEPYVASTLDPALDAAARRYLGSPEGLRVDGNTLLVSSIFKWYGDDFIAQYGGLVTAPGGPRDRAILGTIIRFGPGRAADQAKAGRSRIDYLDYNWALNDVVR